MPLISSISEPATESSRSRFGYHQNQQPEPPSSQMKRSSSPDISTARSFEFQEDPSFWKEHNVQVIIRLRPLSSSELSTQGNNRCVKQDSSQSITWNGHPESRFTFDLVADENVSQEMLFKVAGVRLVENCMEGYNSCMFAYGQTGSGKTHTMLGDIEGGARRHSVNCGMTPRVFEYLFSRIQKDKDARREEKLKFTCRCSFLEIYNEQILDLLDPSSVNLQIREDSKKGVYVENLTEVEVTSARDVIQQLIQGAANRKVASTNMNHASSRSHSVFTCIIESKWESQGVTHHRFARLNLVDLAGSERQKSSGAEGERLKEATNINKSLSTLGLVIMNLVSVSNGKSLHVPYRDSKLTFLLQDSLGGNAKTIIIANVSPSTSCSLETLSTLKFAQRAKFIKNHAIVNEDASGDVLALRIENQNLKKEVSHLRSLVTGGVESNDSDILSLAFPVSPGSFKLDGLRGFSTPLMSGKKMSHLPKKEYEVALVGAFRREKDKDTAIQALTAENQAALQLAKHREDEIQGLKMRLRFREAGIKRLEAVASGKMSAEIHLLKEKEEYLKEIEVLRAHVDRNQEVTRFAMENLRLKEEIRRLKSFCEEGERERMTEQILILENKLLEALDWKLMHESDPAKKGSHNITMDIESDDYFLNSNQESSSPWRTSMNAENEFLRIQAIQSQSELDSLQKKLEFCTNEKEKLERHVNDLAKELEAERLAKEVMAAQAQNPQTNVPSLINDHSPSIGQSDQTEIKTMVDAIATASQREAEAHECAILLSKENDELRRKLKVLIEDNNKLIELYERAEADSSKMSCDVSVIPQENSFEDHNSHLSEVSAEKELEMEREFESLKHQLTEMHEENDKLLSLYEKAMQERDEYKRVIASGQRRNVGTKEDFSSPEKLVEIDEGLCLRFGEASISVDDESGRKAMGSLAPYLRNDDNALGLEEGYPATISESLLEETNLYDVHVQDTDAQSSVNSHLEVVMSDMSEKESSEFIGSIHLLGLNGPGTHNDCDEDNHVNRSVITNMEMEEKSSGTLPLDVFKDLDTLRTKLVEAQENLSYSAKTMSAFCSLERLMAEIDALSVEICKLESGVQAKHEECALLKSLSSELHDRKDVANNKLFAVKHSLTSLCTSLQYFENREARAKSRLTASSQNLTQRKDELAHLHFSKKQVMDSLLKFRQTETEMKNCLENLKSKVEEESKKLESDRVLFAIDNVDRTTGELSQRNWQKSGTATELLKSEEEKTKLQNQIKLGKENLRNVRKEVELLTGKLSKIDSEIQVLEMEVQKESLSEGELQRKLHSIVKEKEMLLEVKENGKHEIESVIIEYHQSFFAAELKDEEAKNMDEELANELRKIDDLRKAKAEAMKRKTELVEIMPCSSSFVSDKMEEDLRSAQMSVAKLNSLLQNC
ncbi:hypothetical protein ABFS82_04G215700 [Erythranthe guttata]